MRFVCAGDIDVFEHKHDLTASISQATSELENDMCNHLYNKVQARDDSVQQDIIHRVPRSHSSITRTRAITEHDPTQTESELKTGTCPISSGDNLIKVLLEHSAFYYSHRVSPAP